MTKKQLIVVVHGVGTNMAGVCSRALAANLSSNQDAAEPSSLPVSNETFYVGEEWQSEQSDLKTTFPVTATHYKTKKKESVIADFYWGDVSSIGGNIASLIIAFITTILGLAHPLRENTKKVYGDKHWMRTLVDLLIKMIHGPIAASTMMIVAGLFTIWGYNKAWGSTTHAAYPVVTIVVAFALIGYGLAFANSSTPLIGRFAQKSYLGRHLGKWLIVISAAFLSLLLFEKFFLGLDPNKLLPQLLCRIRSLDEIKIGDDCLEVYKGAYIQGAQLIVVVGVMWLLSAILLTVIIISDLFITKLQNEKNIVSANASALFFLWLLLAGFTLGAIAYAGANILPSILWLRSGFLTLPVVVTMLLALILVAIATVIKKSFWVSRFNVSATREFQPNSKDILDYGDDKNRTIVHPWLRGTLTITGLVVTISMFLQTANILFEGGKKTETESGSDLMLFSGPFGSVSDSLALLFPFALIAVGLTGTLLFSLARTQIRAGLEIFLDVITYLNDYTFGQKNTEPDYPLKDRIEARLLQSINLLLARDNFDELVIISHSQGTVFAINTLKKHAATWRRKLNNKGTVKLITMGSPFTHIYEHYFQKRVIENLTNDADTDLDDWVNIFRIDDFVGTYIDRQGTWPKEVAVSKNGHTNYWVDKNVAGVIRDIVDWN